MVEVHPFAHAIGEMRNEATTMSTASCGSIPAETDGLRGSRLYSLKAADNAKNVGLPHESDRRSVPCWTAGFSQEAT